MRRVWRHPKEKNHYPHPALGQELYRFEKVPALVCAQCGDVWLEAAVSQLIDDIIQKQPKPKKYQKVPIFSIAELTKL